MNFEELRTSLPDYAKDIKLNLSSVLSEPGSPELTAKQIYFVALGSAYACKNRKVIDVLVQEAKQHLLPNEIESAAAAATIMAMNNVYYRFTHLVSDQSYMTMPAKLRMSIIGTPGVDKIDFELACLAISSINGCGKCMDAHTKVLTEAGVSKPSIQSAVKIAAVINAFALNLSLVEVD